MKTETIVLCIVVLAAHSMLVLGDCDYDGKILKTGETFSPPGKCVELSCDENGGLSGKGCPSIATTLPCEMVEDTSKPYPQCCPYYDCDIFCRYDKYQSSEAETTVL